MSERKSSIHINPVKPTSEQHNNREQELNYVFPEHTHENEQWIGESIADREKTIKRLCKQISGRKMQKNAEPIREGVVNLQSHHTMEDLQKLKSDLAKMVYTDGKYEGQKKWRFEIIQMYLHKDEGVAIKDDKKEVIEPKSLDPNRVNYHAHLVFDWQDKENGKMLRYARGQMADLQTDVAKSLGMQRGKEKTVDKRTANERLEPVEYKVKQRGKELVELQSEISELEQKKNSTELKYWKLAKQIPGSRDFIEVLAGENPEDNSGFELTSKEELEETHNLQLENIRTIKEDILELSKQVEGDQEFNRQTERLSSELYQFQKGISDEETNILKLRAAIKEIEGEEKY
jgi:hypothetical protein